MWPHKAQRTIDTMEDIAKSRQFVLGNDRDRDIEKTVANEMDSENHRRSRSERQKQERTAGSAHNQNAGATQVLAARRRASRPTRK